ncbi:hypothetical protein [Kibdelosporangium philippinense]|uniref:hypothetical protein n=1 Tax=Kibdelosporangium philippinense TaxID=211113 RepID=UPI0027E0923C|nr:hypothetical protein [Kibdelosporangium philippinense]
MRYEAENATISNGVVESSHAGFSGTGFVNYTNGTAENRPVSLSVNGFSVEELNFPGTGAWTSYSSATTTLNLNAGNNIIRATATTASGGTNADYLDVL